VVLTNYDRLYRIDVVAVVAVVVVVILVVFLRGWKLSFANVGSAYLEIDQPRESSFIEMPKDDSCLFQHSSRYIFRHFNENILPRL